MSHYEGITSFSQVYSSSDGQSQLDTLQYKLPYMTAAGTTAYFTVTEKPEEMQLRIIKQLISSQIVLKDILALKDVKNSYTYRGRLLVRDAYSIDVLNDTCSVSYIYRRNNYS
jgi:hypothetical protein